MSNRTGGFLDILMRVNKINYVGKISIETFSNIKLLGEAQDLKIHRMIYYLCLGEALRISVKILENW